MKKKGLGLLLAFCLGIGISGTTVLADTFHGERTVTSDMITVVDENGNVSEVSEESGIVEDNGVMTLAEKTKVVNFNIKTSGAVTEYTEEVTGTSGYTYGGYAADAAYLGMTSDGKVRFMLAGVIGKVNATEVQIVDKTNVQALSHYYVSGGRLKHRIITNLNSSTSGSNLDNGPAPFYLKEGMKYYSYDGHYFYTEDNFENMLADYNNKTRANSINASNPFYNYFQYLPFRSKTNYSVNDINVMLAKRVQATSKMRDIGEALVTNQNTYGANALLMTGVAANESAWGMSSIALNKNNLFGLNAIDSSPGQSANYFESVSQCIKEYSERWLSKEYLNPSNWKYFGGFLGNKASGLNVKYASDPYWGEKAAAMAWNLDRENGNKDAKKYTIAIKDMIGPDNVVNVRNLNSTSSTVLYKTPKAGSCAYIVLNDTSENKFYKIQNDGVLNSERTGLDSSTGVYNFNSMYAYLSSDYLEIISKGTNIQPEPEPEGWSLDGVKTNVTSPQEVNTAVTISAQISGATSNLQYKFVWMKDNWNKWGVIHEFSKENTAQWLPKEIGVYTLYANVKGMDGKILTKEIRFEILKTKWNFEKIITNPVDKQKKQESVKIQAITSGNTQDLQYKFVWMKDNWKEWGVIKEFGKTNTVIWKTPNKSGEYKLYVNVKSLDGEIETRELNFTLVNQLWNAEKVIVNKNLEEQIYTKIPVETIVTGDIQNLQYKFVWMKDNWKEWGVIKEFNTENSANTWYPKSPGVYTIYANVKDVYGRMETVSTEYEVLHAPWELSELKLNGDVDCFAGDSINVTAVTNGKIEGLKYKFVCRRGNDWSDWKVIQEFAKNNSVEIPISQDGNYTIYVNIKDERGVIFDAESIVIRSHKYLSAEASSTIVGKGQSVKLYPNITGDKGEIQYKYVWMQDNWEKWEVIKEFSMSESVEWTPLTSGEYTIYINARANGKIETKELKIEVKDIDPNKPMMALTFDDGPGAETGRILDILDKYNARATFFMLGDNAKKYPNIVKRIAESQSEIGNHSLNHTQLTSLSATEIKQQMNNTADIIAQVSGGKRPTLMRPPGGATNTTVKNNVGFPIILWSIDTLDWQTRNTQNTINVVLNQAKDGDIVLMHDIHKPSVEAAVQLIPKLVAKGYQLVTVSELAEARGIKMKNGEKYYQFEK